MKLRIATLNVGCFISPLTDFESHIDKEINILCIQEGRDDRTVREFAELLGMEIVASGVADFNLTNAILVRNIPGLVTATFPRKWDLLASWGEKRVASVSRIHLHEIDICFDIINTHLDAYREQCRLEQLELLTRYISEDHSRDTEDHPELSSVKENCLMSSKLFEMKQKGSISEQGYQGAMSAIYVKEADKAIKQKPIQKQPEGTIIVGDLNSLTVSDYPGELLSRLRDLRYRATVEAPRFSVTSSLSTLYNYTDSLALATSLVGDRYTTPHSVRVDYVYFSKSLTPFIKELSQTHTSMKCTDHSMVDVSIIFQKQL